MPLNNHRKRSRDEEDDPAQDGIRKRSCYMSPATEWVCRLCYSRSSADIVQHLLRCPARQYLNVYRPGNRTIYTAYLPPRSPIREDSSSTISQHASRDITNNPHSARTPFPFLPTPPITPRAEVPTRGLNNPLYNSIDEEYKDDFDEEQARLSRFRSPWQPFGLPLVPGMYRRLFR